MIVEVDVEPYTPERGLSLAYDDGFKIAVEVKKGEVVVAANRAGLLTLARALLTLAQAGVPPGQYLDFDKWSGLEAGSPRIYFIKSVQLTNSER